MARGRSPERDQAQRLWMESGGTLSAQELAQETGVKPEQIRKWKSLDRWQAVLEAQRPRRKRGGQIGNKNAVGMGAPVGNLNAQTHGAYASVRLESLPPNQQEYIKNLTLDTESNMLTELQQLIAKESDLQNKILKLESESGNILYTDRVVELRVPQGEERLKARKEKLDALIRERDALQWEMEDGEAATKIQEKRMDKLHREIANLQDRISDKEQECEDQEYKVNMQTVMQSSAFERVMKLEAELNRTHGRIIKLLDSIKGYELEGRRIRLEERRYHLMKQKLSGAFDVDPDTGEIQDEDDGFSDTLDL